ncbi:hypothetical protein RclHR1_03520024 [Rhizophagus clarus]|uniref:Uncharacterized protein n=1 Tax=Rhizophagus clarus TaxID=94130 RepID=A0A2Z6RMP9_9GLOM|nr:hypothetical protein RclHR1_03520024 [Rhizophagus clarus]
MECDDQDDLLRNLTLNSGTNSLNCSEKPLKRHILVEPPPSTATSSREQELLDELTALLALHNKPVHGTYKILGMVDRLQ